jgi:hypothetical protein
VHEPLLQGRALQQRGGWILVRAKFSKGLRARLAGDAEFCALAMDLCCG